MNGPTIAESIDLRLRGDWGMANFHRVCGWLSQEAGERTGPNSKFLISNGHGGFDAAQALASREVDLAITTPSVFARMATQGLGPFEGKPIPELRALAVIPQRDRLVLAIDASFGVTSFEELRQAQPPLKIAVSCDDGRNHIGYATMRLMEAAGVGREVLEGWGGGFIERQRPDQCVAIAQAGQSDAVFQEAIMTPWWRELLASRNMNLIPVEDDVLAALEARYGWARAELPAGYFPQLTEALVTLDYSDFVVMVREDMPEDLAHLLTWCLVETREGLERQYRHMPPDRSPVTYPLEPRRMAMAAIDLHRGAERYYREAGHI
jgi:TRAP-type uncharacterized transport system substrate-binding protein